MPFFGDDREEIINETHELKFKIRQATKLMDVWEEDCDSRLIPYFDQLREILVGVRNEN